VTTAAKYLFVLFAFGAVTGTVYWFLTYEPAGTVLLWSFSLMPLIVAVYAVRRGALRDHRDEDDPDATPQGAAGQEIGTFPATTAWPILLMLGAIVVGASLVYGLILLPVGLALVAWAVFGLMRESRG
jgi:hypothetical protein